MPLQHLRLVAAPSAAGRAGRPPLPVILFGLVLLLVGWAAVAGPVQAARAKGHAAERTAAGEFEVTITLAGPTDGGISGMALSKTFHGGLAGTSKGEMLATTPVDGSAGYVAMERVTGTLDGRQGSFVLQHSGTMAPGSQTLSVTVVPGSGTGGLTGLAGAMAIRIERDSHFYTFRYALPR